MKIVAILLILTAPFFVDAGIMDQYILAPLSQGSYRLHQHGACPRYDEETAQSRFREAQNSCPQSSTTALPRQVLVVSQLNDHVKDSTEDRFFALLARQQAMELRCASDFAGSIHKMSDAEIADQLDRLKLLRVARRAISESSMEIATNFNIMEKGCPNDLSELRNQPSYPGGEDLHYKACRKLIENRSSYSTLIASFPLSNRRALSKFLDRYATQKDEQADASTAADLRAAYASAGTEIGSEAEKLESQLKTTGGAGLDRAARHVLLQDPRVVSHVIDQAGNDANVRGVACRADSRYGSGADAMSIDLNVAMFALDGAAVAVTKLGSIGLRVYEGASSARAAGAISMSTSRMFQASALAINGISAYSTISNACFANAPLLGTAGTDKKNQCVAAPRVQDIPTDSCVAKSLLVGLSLEASAPSAVRDLIKKILSTNAKHSTTAGLNATNVLLSGATGLPSATAITVAHIRVCENPPCLNSLRFVEGSRSPDTERNDLSEEQKNYLNQVLGAKRNGQINSERDVNYWLTPNNGGAGTIGQINSDRGPRPFQSRDTTPFFPPSTRAADVITALENGKIAHIASTNGHGVYSTNLNGNRYRIRVCENEECESTSVRVPLVKGDVISVTPVCGTAIRRAVNIHRAQEILLDHSDPKPADFYESVPCP